MSQLLEELLEKTNTDPGDLLHLTAVFIENAASSNKVQIDHYHDLITKLFIEHTNNSPIISPMKALVDGFSNFYLTNYTQAKENLEGGINLFKTGFPTDILGAMHMGLGAVYRSLGEIDLAVENEIIATEILNPNGYFGITYAYAFYQLGEIHVSIGEYDSAQIYYDEALSIISKTEDTTANFRINNGLGVCYLHLEDYKESLYYFNTALSISGISAAEKSRGLCDLGVLNLRQDNYNEAIEFLEESLEIRRSHNLEDAASTSLMHLGDVHFRMQHIEIAIGLLEEALSIADKYGVLSKKITILRLLSKANEANGNKSKALKLFNEYDTLNNEVRSQQEHKIFRLKNKQIESQKLQVHEKNVQLKSTLDELAKVKNSRKSLFFSIGTAITLVILTEAFFDPLIDSYAYNVYLSLGVKVLIALMLKPMESFYDRILFRKAMKMKD